MRQSTRGSDLPGAWEPQAGQTSEKRGGKEMAKQAGIDETLRAVRQQLEQTRPQLEVLSGAIWDAINHDDSAALEEGVRFKQSYNERRQQLERAAADMLALLRGWPQSGPGAGTAKPEPAAAVEVPTPPAPTSEPPAATGAPMVQDATLAPDAKLARALEKKVPFGFVLSGQTFTSASAWPLFYEALLQELYARAPEKISHLADVAAGLQYESNPLFARVPESLGIAVQGAPRDEDVGPGACRAGDRRRPDPAVDFDVDLAPPSGSVDHLSDLVDLRLHRRDVGLTAESGIDGHHEHQIDEIEDVGDLGGGCGGTQRNRRRGPE